MRWKRILPLSQRAAGVSEGPSDRAETGAALVEMALTLTLLVMLLVGVVTSAIALGRDNSLQNAAREASRFAATFPGALSDPGWLGTVRDVARAAALGDLDATVPNYYICVAFVDGTNDVRLVDSGGPIPPPGDQCYTDNRPVTEERVQVVTGRDSNINAILFSTDVALRSQAAARYERQP